MDRNFQIIKLINPRVNMSNIKQIEDEGSLLMKYTGTMLSQIVKCQNDKEIQYVCSQIQNFIEKNGIDICFVINEQELTDCLQNHNKLKLENEALKSEIANRDKALEMVCTELRGRLCTECYNDWLMECDGKEKCWLTKKIQPEKYLEKVKEIQNGKNDN